MKKRNDEGFALAYVVVVIVILCTIALALMSSTLHTLQSQQAMIQRMQNKYEAQGEIERLVAEIEAELIKNDFEFSDSDYSSSSSALNDARAEISGLIDPNTFDLEKFDLKLIEKSHSDGVYEYDCVYEVIPGSETISIHSEITLPVIVTINEDTPDPTEEVPDPESQYSYSTMLGSTSFTSYEITSKGSDS